MIFQINMEMVRKICVYFKKINEVYLLDDKLSTLFNTTGREKNSTGPLKQWLFEHQHHPCL